MAVEKDVIRLAIETKYKGKSLSKLTKDKLAAAYAPIIDNETDIEDFLNGQDIAISSMITEADTRVTEAVKKVKPTTTTTTEVEEIETEGMTAFEKTMLKKFGELENKISGFETQQTQQTLTQRFKGDERLKGVPEFILNRSIPKSEEEFESTITDLVTEYSTFAQANKIENLGTDIPPSAGGGNSKPNDGKVDADLVKFATTLNESAKSEK
jgi:hypothetical protein